MRYFCTKCRKECASVPVAVYGEGAYIVPEMPTQEPVSSCHGQPIKVRK